MLLLLHITNRHLELRPVVAAAAKVLGLYGAVHYDDNTSQPAKKGSVEAYCASSTWAVLLKNKADITSIVQQHNGWHNIQQYDKGIRPWTDNYSNILSIIKWKK